MKPSDVYQIIFARQFTGFRRLLLDGGNIKRIIDHRQSVWADRQVLLQVVAHGL
ncbi:hypothetical protein D3C80_2109870 [compost metagenome]